MEKSLLKQALSMGMEEGCTIRLLPGGELCSPRSRESSVPLEDWTTGGQTEREGGDKGLVKDQMYAR